PFLPHHTPTTHTYPLSLHDALPISRSASRPPPPPRPRRRAPCRRCSPATPGRRRRTGPRAPPRGSARAGLPASLVPLHGLAHLPPAPLEHLHKHRVARPASLPPDKHIGPRDGPVHRPPPLRFVERHRQRIVQHVRVGRAVMVGRHTKSQTLAQRHGGPQPRLAELVVRAALQ